ncbi:MAG: hypothetical protein EXS43_07645 [Opitutus sp.]|nr:hypothetical protein [Opitutus sp.]
MLVLLSGTSKVRDCASSVMIVARSN